MNLKVINISSLCFKNSKGIYEFQSNRLYGLKDLDTGKFFSFDGEKPYTPARKVLLDFANPNHQNYIGKHNSTKWVTSVERPR